MKRLLIVYATAALILPCIAGAIPLGTVNIGHTGYGARSVITLWGGGNNPVSGYAGVYMFNKTGSTGQGDLWPDGLIGGFCIDLTQHPASQTLTYNVTMPELSPEPIDFLGGFMGVAKAEYIRELWGRYFDPGWVGSGPFTPQQNSDAEAFAAAIWEIIYEQLPDSPSMWDVTVDGTVGELGFRCTQTDTATANSWLHSLDGTGPKANLRTFTHNCKQDYIVEVPEPGFMVLLGTGLFAVLRFRRQTQNG